MVHAQDNSSVQEHRLEQKQLVSSQQVLTAKLTELTLEELCVRIKAECEENPWLEATTSNEDRDFGTPEEGEEERDGEEKAEEGGEDVYEERESAANDYDDDFPQPQRSDDDNKRPYQDREVLSFHDMLMQQIGEYQLTEKQQQILEYLIGSLDKDGLLRLPLEQIVDELDIYCHLRTRVGEVKKVLGVLQQFDPWGVGARNLYECLLIQVRKNKSLPMRNHLIELLTKYTVELSMGHWEIIRKRLNLTETELQTLRKSIRRLNPRPGGSVGATNVDDNHHVVPDFIVSLDEEGNPRFRLNEVGLPRVTLANDYDADSALALEHVTSEKMRIEILSAQRFQKTRMEEGKLFIDALAQRRRSMLLTMGAILRLQDPFFRDGDESLLRPMILEDISNMIHLDISTVSRVCRAKIVETPYGTYPLSWFFSTKIKKNGEDASIRQILNELQKLVENEDRSKPYSDEKLATMLREKGYNAARRTVTKYRVQLGIPDSRLRR